MNALLLSDTITTLLIAILLQCQGCGAGQFTAAPPTCSGDTFSFTCTVDGDDTGITTWRVGRSSDCPLSHRSTSSSSVCGPDNDFTARSGIGFGTTSTSFSSSLSGTASSNMDSMLFECFGPDNNVDPGNMVGSGTLQVVDPPTVSISCVNISESISGGVNVTVSWTLSGGDSVNFYLIIIKTNASQIPYGGLLNITNTSVTQYELTGFMAGYEYNITVCGVNCRRQEGRQSESLTIRPQEIDVPIFEVCAVYDIQNKTLQMIESSWTEVDTVTISEDCINGKDIRASYKLIYNSATGTLNTTCIMNGTECSNGKCHHQFKNNIADNRCQPPVSQFGSEAVTMSVAAKNVLGRSNFAKSRIITGRNIDLEVHVDTANLSNCFVKCIFQLGFNCTIDYGTNPSYTNLDYRDTSSTLGQEAIITLSQQIRGDTTYYYIVSARSSSHCVRVRGRFQPADRTVGDEVQVSTVLLIILIVLSIIIALILVGIIGVLAVINRRNQNGAQRRRDQDDALLREPLIPQESPLHIAAQNGDLNWVQSLVDGKTDINITDENERTPLHVAAERGCSGIVKYLVEKGAVVDIEDKSGMTPLHVAAEKGHFEEIVGYLVDKGTNINVKDNKGRTPLHIAVGECQVKTVKSLLEKNADINIQDNDGWTPLHIAVRRGYEKTVKLLVKKEANPNIQDEEGRTPLHVAAATGGRYEKIVEYLVDNNADIDIQDKNLQTPMHVAAREGHEYTVKALLKKTPNVDIQDKDGWTPLDVAKKRGHDVIAEAIEGFSTHRTTTAITMDRNQNGAQRRDQADPSSREPPISQESALHIAAQNGDLNCVKSLVDGGTDINITDENERTPLHVAAEGGCSRIVKYLVEKGAVVNIRDKSGMTPLHVAAEKGHFEEIIGYLVDKGANINVEDNDGRTPLRTAVGECQVKTVKSLVERNADINIQDNDGWTPLHLAVRRGYKETVKLLVKKEANPNIQDEEGRTPLHVAAATGGRYENIVEYLVDHNANINIQDKNLQTPVHVAAREGHEYTVKALLKKTPNVDIQDKDGWTPLDVAKKRGHDVIAEAIEGFSTGILRRRTTTAITMDSEGSG